MQITSISKKNHFSLYILYLLTNLFLKSEKHYLDIN